MCFGTGCLILWSVPRNRFWPSETTHPSHPRPPDRPMPKSAQNHGFWWFFVFFRVLSRPAKRDPPRELLRLILGTWVHRVNRPEKEPKSMKIVVFEVFLRGFWEVLAHKSQSRSYCACPSGTKRACRKRPLRPHPKKDPKKGPFASFPGCLPSKQGFWPKTMKNGVFRVSDPQIGPSGPQIGPRINSLFRLKIMGKTGKNGIDFTPKTMKNVIFEGFSPGSHRHMHRNGPSIQGIFS